MIAATDAPAAVLTLGANSADVRYKVAGIFLVSVLPALFWTLVIAQAGHAFNATFTTSGLAMVCGAMALFLAAVCTPLMARH